MFTAPIPPQALLAPSPRQVAFVAPVAPSFRPALPVQAPSPERVYPASTAGDQLPPALVARRDECIQIGGIFDPAMNRCCNYQWLEQGIGCPYDLLEQKHDEDRVRSNQRLAIGGAVVGVVALAAGLVWWKSKSSAPSA